MDTNVVAQQLSNELGKFGASELTFAVSLFSSEKAKKAGIKGSIQAREFRVIMFDASDELGMPRVSAHFSLNMNADRLSAGHIEYWNADNRFSKIYRQDDDVYLVMDTFLPEADDGGFMRSVAAMWDMAVREIPKFKAMYERKKSLF